MQVSEGGDRGQNLEPLPQREDGPRRPLEPADRGIAIEGDDEDVAQALGLVEQPDMSGMEKVETAVGEDDLLAPAFEPPADRGELFEAVDFPGFSLHPAYDCGGLIPIPGEQLQPWAR